MATVNQVFQSAPMGRRVVFGIAFAFGMLLIVFGINLYFVGLKFDSHISRFWIGIAADSRAAAGARLFQVLAPLLPLLPLLLVVPSLLIERSRVSQFSIQQNILVIGRKRYPLEGLVEVGKDPQVLTGARKRWGNGGLGAIRGKYRSKRLGNFETFLTYTEHAVVLRWPDKVVAVSPADPEFFIYSARAAAGLG